MALRVVFVSLFFVSGAAAVLYQVIWQRLLTFTTGADVHSVSIIVAAFMAGLGLGSLIGGALADRLSARRRLLAFAACELGIALFAVLSAALLYDVLYVRLGEANLPQAALGAIGFIVLLWPTVLMGMSLPLAARILTADARRPDEWVPVLYGWNTLGAAAGAVLAVVVLFRRFDFHESLLIGAAMNATFGIVAAVLAAREKASGASTSRIVEHAPPARTMPAESAVIRTFGAWMALYVLSGFVALSLELVWFRVLGVVHKSTALTFGLLLGMFLTGLGAGSLAGHMAWARRLPAARSFLIMQAAIPIYAGLALAALVWMVELPQFGSLAAHLGSYDARPSGGLLTPVYLFVLAGVPFLLMAPATFLMGLSFGSLQRAVQTDLDGLGRRVGWLQAANILGAVAGTLLTGFVLLDRVGTTGTMRLLVAVSIVFLWLLFRSHVQDEKHSWVRMRVLAPVSLLAAALVAIPSGAHLWASLHGTEQSASVHAEDSTGLTLLKNVTDRTAVVFSNGLGQSQLPYGGIHTALGALPILVHPAPYDIAVIGLGSGNTAYAVAGREETRAIHAIEIVSANLAGLRAWARTRTSPGLVELLQDPRVRFHLTDGRAFLLRSAARYDVIEADALRASSAYSGNLYSVEYFQLLRARLKPGGLAVSWVATPRTRDSLVAAFPHVLLAGPIGFGSETPIPFDVSSILARLDHPFTRAHYDAAGLDMRNELRAMLSGTPTIFGPEFDRTTLTDLNRDLAPRDEFRRMWETRVP